MPGVHLLWVAAPEVAAQARPGQFLMVRCGDDYEHPLRRPLSIHQVKDRSQLALLFSVVGWGTQWLSRCKEGEGTDILGPLGNGFSVLPSTHRLLLIAGGMGIAPLTFLAQKALAQNLSVTLLLGAATASCLLPPQLLPSRIEIVVATENGSLGHKGLITDLLPDYASEADQIFACGPVGMYRAILAQGIKRHVQVSLEARMGCGLGACYACSIKTTGGRKRVCKEGPIFELAAVILDELPM